MFKFLKKVHMFSFFCSFNLLCSFCPSTWNKKKILIFLRCISLKKDNFWDASLLSRLERVYEHFLLLYFNTTKLSLSSLFFHVRIYFRQYCLGYFLHRFNMKSACLYNQFIILFIFIIYDESDVYFHRLLLQSGFY